MKKEAELKKKRQPEGDHVTTTMQHENRFDRPQVKA